jgi:hypothetical protein
MPDTTAMIAWLYSWAGPLMALAYLPQIRVLWRSQDHAPDTSLLTWFMWTLGLGITTAYAAWVNGDLAFLLTSASSFTGCVVVFVMAAYKRWRYSPSWSFRSTP